MHAFTHSYIHTCLSFVYMYSFLCFVVFYLSLSFLTLMHFYHAFLACSIYSFRYVYHIFISYNLIFISCHLLITSYILLTYIFMYSIKLSYLMTYTYTFLYLYVLLVLYQTVLSPIGVQNIDFFFNTLRYPSCPNYLPFYLFLFRYTRINICLLGLEIKNERDSVQYIPEGTVRYRTETCLPT